MNFGSSFVNLDVSDDELEELEVEDRLVYSDCEVGNDYDDDDLSSSGEDVHRASSIRTKKRATVHKATTNIVALQLGDALGQEVQIATGDPEICSNCASILSATSSLTAGSEEGVSEWACEFCGITSSVFLDSEEIPKEESYDYIINNGEETRAALVDSTETSASELTIFCVDISGSMCVTSEMRGNVQLRSNNSRRGFDGAGEDLRTFDQRLPSERDDVTYVSRLQCVQAAVDAQISALELRSAKLHDKHGADASCKVGLVTFNNEVTVVGDGVTHPVVMAGDKLEKFDEIVAQAESLSIDSDVAQSGKALRDKVFGLEEGGPTALGPALLLSVAMAAKHGGKVVVCTDGMSNVGVGALEDKSEEELVQVNEFFERVGELAAENGVLVSVVSIKGTSCRMEYLGRVADRTGGSVTIVDPLNLTNEFANILQNEIIATNVSVSLITHGGLYIVDQENDGDDRATVAESLAAQRSAAVAPDATVKEKEKESEQAKYSKVTREIGNVTSDSSTTFQYGVHSHAKQDASLTQLPFQVQIRFTRKSDGLKLCRVISRFQKITRDRKEAEERADLRVIGTHAAQTSARLAHEGDYTKSRAYAWKNKEYLKRITKAPEQEAQYNKYKVSIAALESNVLKAQQEEISRGQDLSCDEMDDFDEDFRAERGAVVDAPMAALDAHVFEGFTYTGDTREYKGASKARRANKKKSRAASRNDETSSALFGFKKSSFL